LSSLFFLLVVKFNTMQRIPTEEPDIELGDMGLLQPAVSTPYSPPLPAISFRERCVRVIHFIRSHRQGIMLGSFLSVVIVLFAVDNRYLDIVALTLLSFVGFTLCLRAFMIARGLRLAGFDLYDARAGAGSALGSLTLREQMLMHQTMYGDSLWIPNVRSNSTHLRLSMMDRDFNSNDYEVLLRLDDEVRARTFTGIPQSQINRLPTFTLKEELSKMKLAENDVKEQQPSTPSSSKLQPTLSLSPSASPTHISSSTSSTLKPTAVKPISTKLLSSSGSDNTRKCAVCLELQLPGQTLRSLPCLHNFHIDCIDPWLRIKPVCPICHIEVLLPSGFVIA